MKLFIAMKNDTNNYDMSTLLIGQNKQVRLTKLNKLKNKILVHQIIQNRAFKIFFIL